MRFGELAQEPRRKVEPGFKGNISPKAHFLRNRWGSSARYSLLLCLLWVLPAMGFARGVPYLTGWVNDEADLLSTEAEQEIASLLAGFEEKTGSQIVVLTVDSLQGEDLKTFALRSAETWGLGARGKDNGVLLLIAVEERQARIEVGYGLEGRLTDAECGRILNAILRPAFRRGDFDLGTTRSAAAILEAIGQDLHISADSESHRRDSWISSAMAVTFRALLSLFYFTGLLVLGLETFHLQSRASWLIYLLLLPFFALVPVFLWPEPLACLLFVSLWAIGFPLVRYWARSTGKELPRLGSLGFADGWPLGTGIRSLSTKGSSAHIAAAESSLSSPKGGGGRFGGGGASSGW